MYKILIVEDDPNISSLLQSHIQKYGYDAVVAENFDDIMESFNAVKPHLVLLDVTYRNRWFLLVPSNSS